MPLYISLWLGYTYHIRCTTTVYGVDVQGIHLYNIFLMTTYTLVQYLEAENVYNDFDKMQI